jgi:hypothetical protein
MLKKLLLGLVFILAAVALVASQQPDDFKVTRSATMDAPASAVFAQVNNLKNWKAWSPWEKLDPNAKISFEGSEAGVGAKMSWAGNMDVGVGSITIAESRAGELVRFDMDFKEPMESKSTAEFTFKEEGGKTQVTWSMYGKNNFIGKVIGLIFNCEKMIGEQFEKGLGNLKTIVEVK